MAGSIGSNGLLVWSMNCMLESSDYKLRFG
jgi:hypothetical protein